MQIHGLASFYLLATGHLNRAWRLCSDAVREAISLGIHLEIIGPCLSGLSKETRYHIWWSLCTLEHRLSVMTGRPCLTAHDVGTVPMPAPFDGRHFPTAECSQVPIPENQNSSYKVAKPNNVGSNPSPLYFVELARLISRARKMMSNLYSPAGMQQPPSIQRRIMVDLVNELDTWSTDLPKELDISATLKADGPLAWQRRSLSVHYYSTMVAMTRPSLDLPVLRQGDERAREPSQTPRDLATECVDSAIHVIRLLTDGAQDPAALRKESPWWCVLHFLVQATAVLGIEMQYSCRHVGRGRANMIKQSAFRALAWLLELSKDGDESAGKAWQKYEPLISRHSAGLPADTTVQNRDPGEKVDRKSTATPDPTSQPSQSGPAQPNNPTDTPFLGESPPGCMVPIDTPAGLTQQETLNNLYLSPWPTTVDEPDSFTSNYHDRTADNDDYQNDVDSYGSYSN
ncbi:CeGAL family transcription factor [Aspergillus lucknowensis]|uniref:Xylanolytic transcriptional activator regulatory domain-containing protein n=1 Tax=Aspergillus lucknowensis TaxID=176173 RepID=A0ABR4M5K8_9EURO